MADVSDEAQVRALAVHLEAQQGQARREDLVARVRRMGDYEFFLEYQPQVSPHTGLCVGCEALLRARDSQGRIQSPGSFLAWLSEAGLMKEVDLWVAAAALRQLTDREKHIIVERRLVDEPKTLEDLSAKYGISRERVRQIEVRAFDKLQKAMKNMVVEAASRPTTQPAPAHG